MPARDLTVHGNLNTTTESEESFSGVQAHMHAHVHIHRASVPRIWPQNVAQDIFVLENGTWSDSLFFKYRYKNKMLWIHSL